MKKANILIGALILLLAGCAGQTDEPMPVITETPKETPQTEETVTPEQTPMQTEEAVINVEIEFARLKNVFGFADETGKRLITLQSENGGELPDYEDYDIAVGDNGKVFEIAFVKRQEKNDRDTFRQTMYNFDNMAGYIYEAKGGSFEQNKTYLLTRSDVFNKNALVELKDTADPDSQTQHFKKVDPTTLQRAETAKNRKIVKSSLLAETIDGAKICLFVFERRGDDMLASLAYIDEDKILWKDYPAIYNEMATWRVDAGDEPGLFEILFLIRSDDGLLLGVSWFGPEGENIFVLKEGDGALQDTDLKNGRYTSPA